jgi:hypothetical protein
MNRRSFVKSLVVASILPAATLPLANAPNKRRNEKTFPIVNSPIIAGDIVALSPALSFVEYGDVLEIDGDKYGILDTSSSEYTIALCMRKKNENE